MNNTTPKALTLLEQNSDKIAAALPAGLDPDRMQRLAVSVFRKSPALQRCKPASFVSAIMDCAQLGLEPGLLNEASLVPFKDECTLVIGYKGLMKCAMRSGEVAMIHPYVVKEGDFFEEELGSSPKLVHKPNLANPGKIIAYYATAKMKSGEVVWAIMTKDEVCAHRDKHAKGITRSDSPWKTNFDGMAKKTVLRQVCKYLPASVEMQRVAKQEDKAHAVHMESIRMDQHHAIQAAPDLADPVQEQAEMQVEQETFKGHMDFAGIQKVDVSDILIDFDYNTADVSTFRAINNQLAQRLEGL